MFAKNSSPENIGKEVETVIGASVKVEGNFVCDGNIVIEGEVKGMIETSGYLQIGPKAIIVADVQAGNARIAGKVQGNLIISGHLELVESAQVQGDINVKSLAIATGAVLNGNCVMSSVQARPAVNADTEENGQ